MALGPFGKKAAGPSTVDRAEALGPLSRLDTPATYRVLAREETLPYARAPPVSVPAPGAFGGEDREPRDLVAESLRGAE